MTIIYTLFTLILLIRFYSLSISIKNEKALIQKGAIQYGKRNSMLLSFIHIIFYFSAIIEASYNQIPFDGMSKLGLIIIIFALIMLFVVIAQLKEIWTVKLYILPDHKINNSFLFKYIRHPNYFLNIIPELIGLVMLCHAKYTAMVVGPIYLIILFIRIKQEEAAMYNLRKSASSVK